MDFKATLSVTLTPRCENSVVNFNFRQYKMSLLVPCKKLKTRATVGGGGAVGRAESQEVCAVGWALLGCGLHD